MLASYDYFAFGQIRNSHIEESSLDKYLFTGKERDNETGLDYFGARYYDARLGRWMSVDPLADKYPGLSPYNYCLNNPLKLIDPNGMYSDNYVAHLDGSIEYEKTNDNVDNFSVENKDGSITQVLTLEKNEDGLVQLPMTGYFEVMQSDGSLNKFGWASYGSDEKRYMSSKAVTALLGVLNETGIKNLGIGNFSLSDGNSPKPSKSYKNGNNGDIRALRSDKSGRAVTVDDSQFDFNGNTI